MFVGYVEPRNIGNYVRRFHVTDGYNLYSLVPMNVLNYIRRLYIRRGIPRLTDECRV
jgi:hypothetical protein